MLRAFPGWHRGSLSALPFGDPTSCTLLPHKEMLIIFHSSINSCLIPPVALLPVPSESLGLSYPCVGILLGLCPISWPL